MRKHKKVCYTLEKFVVDIIEKRSLMENIPKSNILLFYIQNGYELMYEELESSNGKPIKSIRKRKNTIPKFYTLPFDCLEVLNFFSKKLDVKKSHLIMCCVVNFERELKKKEDEKITQQIDELMNLVDKSYHIQRKP